MVLLLLRLQLLLFFLLFFFLFFFFFFLLLLLLLLLLVFAAAAAVGFGGASVHAAGNGVSSSVAGAIKWYGCQCISATGAGGAARVGTDVVLVAVEPRSPQKAGGMAGG